MSLNSIAVAILTMISIGCFAQVLLYPFLSGEMRAAKRQKVILQPGFRSVQQQGQEAAKRRKQIQDSLREMEDLSKKKSIPIEARLMQAGLEITKQNFFIICSISGAFGALLGIFMTDNILLVPVFAAKWGIVVPLLVLNHLKKRRTKKFLDAFPEAVDMIIRGVKSGLPLGACLQTVANQAEDPVRGEFRGIVEATLVGLTVPEAVERMVERMPIPETNFFAIEALGNLSRVLRDRKKMDMKVKAMSSESKSSAIIIGALPVAVSFVIYLMNLGMLLVLSIKDWGLSKTFFYGLSRKDVMEKSKI
jgi:tight adherence protein B